MEASSLPLKKENQVGEQPGSNRLTIVVFKNTMLVDDVGSNKLDVLGNICFWRPNPGDPDLNMWLVWNMAIK